MAASHGDQQNGRAPRAATPAAASFHGNTSKCPGPAAILSARSSGVSSRCACAVSEEGGERAADWYGRRDRNLGSEEGRSEAKRGVLRLRPATLAGGSYTGNMCHCRPCQGIRSSVLRHPPVATFFLCLVTLSVTFLSYGAYIQTHSVKDFTQDWDSFLRTLSLKKICPQGNMTSSSPDLTVGPSKVPAVHTEGLGSVSVLAGIMLSPWQLAVNHTGLRIYTTGGQLGMRGLSADAHLTVTVTSGRWSVQCNNSDTECSVRYCVTVTGPSSLLPRTRSSPSCPESISSDQLLLDLYVVKDGPDTSSKCYHLVYNGDTVLENMVPQERTLIFHRLMLTSISLLTLGVFLCLVSAFCNQPPRMDKWTHVAL
ncbi:insulin-like growth factor-binding protein 3 receptor isoform X2 [Mixophyes fleayi]|uniref:insulin-like growth factor-binding protein 3 receptor isoform X2 n=1 Tax=Mixophyes fleayi TaxID=3061075 RepID=UPI003F4DB4D6